MSRLTVNKTYKLYIGGKFPRTESGRTMEVLGENNNLIAHLSRGSKKDFRNSVVTAEATRSSWEGASAYLKGQILYRIAEMLEGRKGQFIEELSSVGMSRSAAEQNVTASIDLLVHYAGWSDKYQALFSTVNPVASSHFNFSVPNPVGVVGIIAPDKGLLGLVSAMAPVLVGGNTCIVLASGQSALSSISFAEVLATSDVPGGVVNILTGHRDELTNEFAKHKGVKSLLLCSNDAKLKKEAELSATENLKRTILKKDAVLNQDPYLILDFQEVKTTWHPVGV